MGYKLPAVCVIVCVIGWTECWEEVAGVFGMGGVPVEDVDSVADCKAACRETPDCVAINWDPAEDDERCWTVTKGYEEASVSGKKHYRLKSDCQWSYGCAET